MSAVHTFSYVTSTFRTKSVAESHDIIKPGGGTEADALHHREALAELNNTTVPPEGEAFTCKVWPLTQFFSVSFL